MREKKNLNTIKIDEETNQNILKFVKISEYPKTKIVKIVFKNLTNEQFRDIVLNNMKKSGNNDKFNIENDEEGDEKGKKYTDYELSICKECGKLNKDCECEEDEIDWEDDEEDDDDNEEEDEDDWDEERDTHSEEICKGCGEKNIACRCEDIEAEKYSNYKADCKKRNDEFKNKGLDNEENSGKHVKDVPCRICGETIEGCICGNLDGFDNLGETILE